MLNLYNKDIVFFDTETEGLNLLYSRPWELAWSVYKGYKQIESNQFYLKWHDLKVSDGAARVTGFNPFKVEKDGKDPKEIMDLFCNNYLFNEKYIIIGANILGYDSMILNSARKRLGYKTNYSYLNRCYDTVAMAKGYKLNLKPQDNNFLSWQFKMLNTKVKGLKTSNSVMYKELTGNEIDPTKIHSGIYDIELTAAVFFELMKKMEL